MKHVFDYIRKHIFLLLIILPAFFLYMIVIFPSGTFFCFKDACGINFWGVHGHDAIWHMAIANVSFNKLPFIAPTFFGQNLSGYNYFLDLLIFLLSKLGIPALVSYFKLLPVVWFVIFSFLLIMLGRKIKDSPLFVGLFLFFNYFAGSFSYLLTLYRDKTISGSSTLLPQPAMHMMSNLPYAFSLLPFLVLLILMKEKKLNIKKILIFGTCLTLIMGLKFYGGVIAIFMIFTFVILVSFERSRETHLESNYDSGVTSFPRMTKRLAILSLFIISSIFLFYDPFNALKTGSAFGFAPFALVHTITEEPNQFYLQSMTDARYFIMAQGRIGPRLIWIEFLNLMIFLFFYLGTRFFAFFYIGYITLRRKLNKFDLSIVLTIFFSIFLTVTLVQKAEWWNTIQFFFYAIFLLTIYLSMLTYDFIKSRKLILIICSIVLLMLSIPTSLDLVRLFAVTPGATYLPIDEIKALEFLKDQPNGVVLTALYDKKWKNYEQSNHLYTYEDTAYVAAFSGKQEYFANILQLRLTGVNYEGRLEKLKKMDCEILNEVNYIYEIKRLTESKKITVQCRSTKIKNIFENKSVIIYSIIK